MKEQTPIHKPVFQFQNGYKLSVFVDIEGNCLLRLTHRIEDSAAIYLPSEKKEEMLGFFRKTKKQTKQ